MAANRFRVPFVVMSALWASSLPAVHADVTAGSTAHVASSASGSVCVYAEGPDAQVECDESGPQSAATYDDQLTETATGTDASATGTTDIHYDAAPGAQASSLASVITDIDLSGSASAPAEAGYGAEITMGGFTKTTFDVVDEAVPFSTNTVLDVDPDDCMRFEVFISRTPATGGQMLFYRGGTTPGCGLSIGPDAGAATGTLQPGAYEVHTQWGVSMKTLPTRLALAVQGGVRSEVTFDGTPAALTVSSGDVSLAEGNSGVKEFEFMVALSSAAPDAVSVDYDVVGVSAAEGTDFAGAEGTVAFAASEVAKIVTVDVAGDRLREPNETFHVTLSDPQGVTIADGIGIGTIVNDDVCSNPFTAGNDIIDGTSGDDVLCGGDGNDDIDGRGGNDQIIGGDGNDTLEGGAGEDTLEGGAGEDLLVGSDGGDTLTGAGGPDDMLGGAGEDTIGDVTEFGADTIRGGMHGDIINAGPGDDTVHGDDGGDLIADTSGADAIHGGGGGDEINGGDGPDRIWGDGGRDTLTGGDANDRIWGDNAQILVDNDSPADFKDTIKGGPGFDTLRGGPGGDTISGGADDDELHGHASADGDGEDSIEGGLGNDTITGGPHDDILHGQAGVDTIAGNDGGDIINAGPGADTNVNGGDGGDTIIGHDGNDRLTGGDGGDDIFGNAGRDHFRACDGDKDTLRGGPNTDTANYDAGLDIRSSIEVRNPC